jgi:hypothetical protein
MSIQAICVHDIFVAESRFSTGKYLFKSDPDEVRLGRSIEHLGIVNPPCVYRDGEGKYHLIDGEKRIHHALKQNLDRVSAAVLPETTTLPEIIDIIFSDRRNIINESVINKIGFVCFALSAGASESWITESLCASLGLRPHQEFLKECRRIYDLPQEVKHFCHEKRYSLKQLLNLTYLPQDLMLQLLSWKSGLQLTASILEELASNIRDYLKSQDKTLKHLLAEPEVQALLGSSLSPRDRTERLRQFIRIKRFPVLSEINAKIEKTVTGLDLPEGITVAWDRTLENRKIDVAIHVEDPKKWSELIKALNSQKTRKGIETILDEL